MKQTEEGELTLISEGYTAYGEIDQSEGRQGLRQLSSWTSLEEAIQDCRGKGVQGDDGLVEQYKLYLAKGGLVVRRALTVWDRRRDPVTGYYSVGPVNQDRSL